MKIALIHNSIIPVIHYGGTERVIWYLAKELVKLGHDVTLMAKRGSYCDFTKILHIDEQKPIGIQIPKGIELVHLMYTPAQRESIAVPYVITIHGNPHYGEELDINTIFVSRNHAERHGSSSYVHNGLDWDDYSKPDLRISRKYFHFLGNAAWRVKNVRGAIDIIKATKNERLKVLGGKRFNFRMGLRFTFSPKIEFYKSVGGKYKDELLNASKGLIFPVRWHEPFGLAIIESLYFGCPVFATPYGSLPELITPEIGHLSNNAMELLHAVQQWHSYSPTVCHQYAVELFNSKKMCDAYLEKYEKVLNGQNLNPDTPSLINQPVQKFLAWE